MNYPTDLTNSQWELVQKIIPDGRKRKYSLRHIINALLYVVKTGCQWRMLPLEFPSYKLVHYYFTKWKKDGTIELLHDKLMEKRRIKKGKRAEPSAGILDSQSVKSTAVSSHCSGFDMAKKVKGRKRHLLVDTLGFVICVVVHNAAIQDRDGAMLVFKQAYDRLLKVVFADAAYWANKLNEWVKQNCKWMLIIIRKCKAKFEPQPKRWIVERTFAWINNDRRNAKDYERYTDSAEMMIYLSMTKLMLKYY
jgi:putative transposase